MHEVSLGLTLRDYLSGEEIEETTYEEFRQALAKLLVEEKGYPRERLKAKTDVCFPIDGQDYSRKVDLIAYDDAGKPLFLIFFTAGQPASFDREIVAAARLVKDGPAPLVMATDTKTAVLHAVESGECLATGMQAVPYWDEVLQLAEKHKANRLSDDRVEMERRILYTYSEYVKKSCCGAECET